MTEATQPRMARGMKLPAAIVAAALFALLAFAPFASATPDPVASGTTTITLNKGLMRKLASAQVGIFKIAPGSVNVKKRLIKLPVSGGSMDPTNGIGTLTNNGGFKLKQGKKTVALKSLEINTQTATLKGKVGSKTTTIAKLVGTSSTREGFGVGVKANKLKVTSAGAKALNKGLTPKGAKTEKIFNSNQVIGSSTSATQPATVALLPGGNLSFATAEPTIKKLNDVEVKINTLAPTAVTDPTPTHPAFNFPIVGGSIAPTGTAGTIQSAGGLELTQEIPTGGEPLKTQITLANFYLDLSAKTVTVEVIAHSTASKSLDLGALGRSSIADVSLTGATVTSNAATRTVSIQNASTTLQPISAEVLDAFRKVQEGALVEFLVKVEGVPKAEAEKIAAEKYKEDHINAGDPLGTFSFTAQTQ